ncbi:Hypothetical protein DEACI_2819 [Acididesulfobacillus acetoxydans]|uniref:Uncharacterized protein n=1 Tax=Acididesulfobacillus acetoxydans TaxID=1561005 RepID=A0A8S0XC78_9FIRM|nr:Hypothetical protein DEACI_2819 [Acididesulfobacillus acetoxydans]CEJ08011.1 Hypothetical protein DEACI_2486 [Acididesulfobacillus acetoxydans]
MVYLGFDNCIRFGYDNNVGNGVSPSGKAPDSDSGISLVRIQPPQPNFIAVFCRKRMCRQGLMLGTCLRLLEVYIRLWESKPEKPLCFLSKGASDVRAGSCACSKLVCLRKLAWLH